MQKKMRKLTLSHETLRHLDDRERGAAGGAQTARHCNTDEVACPISGQPLCSEAPTGCFPTNCTCP